LDEAGTCFDKAVALNPKGGKLFRERGYYRMTKADLKPAIDFARGEEVRLFPRPFAAEALEDFRRAAALDPDDPMSVGVAAVWELLKVALEKLTPLEPGQDRVWKALSTESRKSVSDAIVRLGELGKSKDARTATDALELSGALQLVGTNDPAGAEANFRRVLELDPSRESAWDMLLIAVFDRPKEALNVTQRRVQHKDSARNRFLLAKAHAKLGQDREAEEHLRAALKREPKDVLTTLALAALLTNRADKEDLAEAGKLLDAAEGLLKESSDEDQKVHWATTRAIHLGLTGNTVEARTQLREVLSQHKDCASAEQALEALEKELLPP
jgi:tetratricopeptide (TPR) repeat protein